ncbi:aspartyl-phosphate phosphatase Spo0E family protein [Bacillus sp. MRMR6]|uniref:aspartyl-phosphate phosphatase Spo0E family protein n=1 Tax=Bacillus sp. MRMR6 TaxID=1928617 RepID=UPI000951894F|nr:aspartyl-phosphate phosphatase Spo0E family protein [Bacillus sp. MRMR6]OLS38527.1 hypothetical protein BTR25_13980 [Bacillus sp. MRMR6]
MDSTKHCPYILRDKIEILREEMIHSGLSKGLNNEQTIKISQKLDSYIALYTAIENNNGRWI